MLYFWFVVAVIFILGVSTFISSQAELAPDVRKNLPPEQIEIIRTELDTRELWGLILIVISMFPVMTYLCLFL